MEAVIFDLHGNFILRESIIAIDQIDNNSVAEGNYLLKVYDLHQLINSYKLLVSVNNVDLIPL
jgi:hypothetical protein